MMKLLLVTAVVLAAAAARPDDQQYYDTRYDSFDVQQLTGNVRLLRNYAHCFLDQGPCTVEGHDFKKIIPDAVRTSCGKCSPKQRQLIREVIRSFQSKLPALWEQLVDKEDPRREYQREFDSFINGHD